MPDLREVQLRHATYFASVLRKAHELYVEGGEAAASGLNLFDEAWENIRTGQAHAEKYSGGDDRAAALCSRYVSDGEHLLALRQHPREQIRWLDAALVAATRLNDRSAEAMHLNSLGEVYLFLGEIRRASAHLELALEVAREVGDRRREAQLLSDLGKASQYWGEIKQAVSYYEEALAIIQQSSDRRNESRILTNLGLAYADLGDVRRAITYHERGLALARALGDRRGEGQILGDLGGTYGHLGEFRKSVDYYEQYLRISRELGDRAGEAIALNNLGLAYTNLGDIRHAIDFYYPALAIAREMGSRREESYALNNLGLAHAKLGEYSKAIDYYESALAIARQLDDVRAIGLVLGNLGEAYGGLDQIERALDVYHQALTIARRNEELLFVAELLKRMGELAFGSKNYDQAKRFIAESVDIYRKLRHPLVSSVVSLLSEVEAAQGIVVSIIETAQRFFNRAGFTLLPVPEGHVYRCEQVLPEWGRILPSVPYTRFLPGEELDIGQVLDLWKQVKQVDPQSSVVFVVTDSRPTDGGWAQIGTLRQGDEPFVIMPIETSLLNEGITSGRERELLRTEVMKRIGEHYDPYNTRDPVAGVFSFFGRDPLVNTLLRRITEGQPIGVFGLRKLGKSSLLKALRHRAPFPVAGVSLQTVSSGPLDQLYVRIFKYWKDWLRVHYNIDWVPPDFTSSIPPGAFSSTALELLDLIAGEQKEARLGIFLDEIEEVVPLPDGSGRDLERYLTLIRELRGLIDEDGRLSLVVAGLNPSINSINAWGSEQNPTFNLFQEMYLPPLTEDDCGQMISNIGRQVDLEYDPDSLQDIIRLSGGHPFLARQLCSLLYKMRDYRAGSVKSIEIPNVIHQFMYDATLSRHIDAGIWEDVGKEAMWGTAGALANKALLLELARADSPVERDDIIRGADADEKQDALFNLERFHIINQVKPETYAIRFGLLHKWLRKRMLGLER